jgi:hypothetical protein
MCAVFVNGRRLAVITTRSKLRLGTLLFAASVLVILVVSWFTSPAGMHPFFVVAAVVGAIACGLAVDAWIERNRKLALFEHRAALSDREIYERFYASTNIPAELVAELWNEIARTLQYDPARILPSDRFGIELSTKRLMDPTVENLDALAASRARRLRLNLDLATIKTVDDYIRAFGSSNV